MKFSKPKRKQPAAKQPVARQPASKRQPVVYKKKKTSKPLSRPESPIRAPTIFKNAENIEMDSDLDEGGSSSPLQMVQTSNNLDALNLSLCDDVESSSSFE